LSLSRQLRSAREAAYRAQSFAAGAEVEIRLWLEAKGVPAAGYRLYVFYP